MTHYREVALEIAEELTRACGGSGVFWTSDRLVAAADGGHVVVHGEAGHDLYGGSAGIGWVLAHLSRRLHHSELAESARAALGGALAAGDAMIAAHAFSLHGGASGVALAAMEGGIALEDKTLKKRAARLLTKAATEARRQGLVESDLIAGHAGIIISLLAFDARIGDPIFRDAARLLCEQLIAASRSGWWGRYVAGSSGVALCGLGHGASGIGWSLIEAGQRLGDARLGVAGEEVLRWEDGWFDPVQGTWPDLRTIESDVSAAPGWMDAWCHGAFGIGAVRWHLWQRNPDPVLLARATASLWRARRAVVAAARTPVGQIADMTLCHGLAGAAELMLIAHEATGNNDHLRAARRVGDLILRLRADNDDCWTVGLPGGRDVPGLFLGRAGLAALFMRLADPAALGSPMLAGRQPMLHVDHDVNRI